MQNDTDFTYAVFGLLLRSKFPIPGLTQTTATSALPPLRIHFCAKSAAIALQNPPEGDEELTYTSSFLGADGEPALRIWQVAGGAYLHLGYSDGMNFWLDRECNNVWGIWPDESSIEDASTYLLGPVLGLSLRLRGTTCLHASAVVIGGYAVAFVGSSGAGKSTTAAALAARGCPVLSDDVVALSDADGCFRVMPAYPYLSLWPESVSILYGSADVLPRFTGDWDKRYLASGTNGVKFEERSLHLGAIYLLGKRACDPAPSAESASRQEALISLVANTYATNTLSSEMRAKEFEVLGRLVSRVPVRKVCPHQDPARINDFCQLICSDFEATLAQAGASPGMP
jgi:hypothetical protein